jgi:hypothetical protein
MRSQGLHRQEQLSDIQAHRDETGALLGSPSVNTTCRCAALSIEAEGDQHGMQNYIVIEGTAEVTEGGAAALLHDLAQIYVGPGTNFPPMPNPPPGFIIRITPTKIRGMGPWGVQF